MAMERPARSPLRGLPVEEQNLSALLERQALEHGDKTLFCCGETRRSFREVRDAAAASAAALADAGVLPGDRVAAMCKNRVELLDVLLGCAWLGAIGVPINTAVRGPQLEHILRNSGARALQIDGELLDVLDPIDVPPTLETVWPLGGTTAAPAHGYRIDEPPDSSGGGLGPRDVPPGETAVIIYTSGTTGPSKGVCCPQAQLYWWGILTGELLGVQSDDVLYTCLPLFHINAFTAFVQALVAGATYVVDERFSASRFWHRAADVEATVTYLLGAMINMLLSQPPDASDRDHRVRVILAPAAPAQPWERFCDRFGVQLIEGYGSTETNCTIGAAPHEQRPGYMGRVLDGFRLRVVDDRDVEVPDGQAGELVLRPEAPFSFAAGYFGMPEKTVEAWRNLWFHTGDRVLREPDGWVRFLDRTKDAIRRRGENIASHEVEQVLLMHPAVAAVAVYPVASEMAEDEVMAAIVIKAGEDPDALQLVKHCEPLLAYFAIPRYIDFVLELPLTENGKVRKAVLRERGVRENTWDRERSGHRLRRPGR